MDFDIDDDSKLMKQDDLSLNENFKPFKETEPNVVMIDPDLKADHIF